MNELRRMAYLEALGIDSYVSRTQLSGAATTRRLAVVRPVHASSQSAAVSASAGAPHSGAPALLDSLKDSLPKPEKTPVRAPQIPSSGARAAAAESVPRFSLAVIASGQWLWLEMLDELPLMSEQVWLVESMASALCVASDIGAAAGASMRGMVKANVMQFDWPIHNNPQLDGSEEAARASLGGFLERQQQQLGAQGVVIMGSAAAGWAGQSVASSACVEICSTRQMLDTPASKKQTWKVLQSLLNTDS